MFSTNQKYFVTNYKTVFRRTMGNEYTPKFKVFIDLTLKQKYSDNHTAD